MITKNEWVAITGSAGYIGSVLAKHCKKQGYNVLGCDMVYSTTPKSKQNYIDEIVACRYEDPMFAVMCAHYKISKIFHLGGSASVPLSAKIPFHFYYNNVGNTAKMLHHLIDNGWHTRNNPIIIFSSTSSVYQENTTHKDETAPIGSPNAYGRSKFTTEYLFKELLDFYNIPSVVFRYFCVAGGYGDVGQPLHYPHIIPRIMDAAYSGKPFTLFGCDWPTPDNSSIRDFISVNDICRAHFHAADYAVGKDPAVHKFNMGTKDGISMLDLIHKFEDTVGTNVPYVVGERRTGDPAILLCDPSRFIKETGFVYNETLEDMLVSAWDWYNFKKEENNGV